MATVQGDSHLRMTYDALVTRLNGTGEAPIYVRISPMLLTILMKLL